MAAAEEIFPQPLWRILKFFESNVRSRDSPKGVGFILEPGYICLTASHSASADIRIVAFIINKS
jgi:hypothetical protein